MIKISMNLTLNEIEERKEDDGVCCCVHDEYGYDDPEYIFFTYIGDNSAAKKQLPLNC